VDASYKDPLAKAGLVFLAGIIAVILWTQPAGAQPAQQLPLPEVPLTFRPPIVARSAGMGGASIAFADDHTACISNPATLGVIRQIEFGIGFAHESAYRDLTYRGNTERATFGKTRLSHLGFAYPIPTYRGSLVVGAAYARVNPLDSDFYKFGRGDPIQVEEEGILEEGGLDNYSGSVAYQPTPNLYLGVTGTILHGHEFYDRTFRFRSDTRESNSEQVQDYTISGVTGNLGALLQIESGVRLGLVLYLPEGLDFEGSGTSYSYLSPGDTLNYDLSQHVSLPYRLGAGIAIARPHLILAADAIYADWSQIDFGGPLRLTSPRQSAYRQTVNVRLGGEVLLSSLLPIRLRAGYDLEPVPYDVVLFENIAAQPYEPAKFERDRHYYTVGAGILLAESLTLDLAYMDGGFKRSGSVTSQQNFLENVKDRRFLASLSLRLPLGRD